MREAIFITGASGFVGRHVLPGLLALGRPVFALDRSGSLAASAATPGLSVVTGDLLDPASYRAALQSCSVVVHLAASTGRASAGHHERVNARGTEVLIEACGQAGVANFLFVSSIATTFPAGIGYHYADAKRRAEEVVARSGLRYAILRPTVITGPGAPNLKSLEQLALLPLIVIPGNGRARVQPVEVVEVAGAIASIVRQDAFRNEITELGGPEVLTMEEQLRRIRQSRTGRAGRVIRVPLGLFRLPLKAAEAAGLVGLLPVTAGQLSSFRFDGVTAEHRSRASHAIAGECRVFTRYLLGRDPDAYVTEHYAAALSKLALVSHGRFDESLLRLARTSRFLARLADSYASLFFRTAALRKRLVLLLAILETRPPYHQRIDETVRGPLPVVLARLTLAAAGAAVSLVAGTLIVAPVSAVLAVLGKDSR